MGDYKSLISDGDVSKDLTITIAISSQTLRRNLRVLHWLTSASEEPRPPVEPQGDESVEYEFRTTFVFTDDFISDDQIDDQGDEPGDDREDVSEQEMRELNARPAHGVLVRSHHSINVAGECVFEWEVKASKDENNNGATTYMMYFPRQAFERSGAARFMKPEVEIGRDLIGVTVILRSLFPDKILARVQPDESNESDDLQGLWSVYPLLPFMEEALKALRGALAKVHYIGPLRSSAKRHYVANLDFYGNWDPAGEFLPYVLRDRSESLVWHVAPKGSRPEQTSLQEALDVWLSYIRTGEMSVKRKPEFDVEVSNEVLVTLKVRSGAGSGTYSLADSGFGYSQILPILVRALMAAKNSSIIIEQPELHLNPSLQVRLAEFFFSMAQSGKQIILETHSEHLVNALRVLTAEDETGSLRGLSRIFFLDSIDNRPSIHMLNVKDDGTVPDWPREFFGDAIDLSTRLLRAQRRFRLSNS